MTTTATELHRRIERASNARRDLIAWVTELEAQRTELLRTRPDRSDDSIAASRARAALRQVEDGRAPGDEVVVADEATAAALRQGALGLTEARRELERLTAEIKALEAELPTPAAVATAKARAEELSAAATEAAGEHIDSWVLVVSALAELLPAAVQLAGARRRRAAVVQRRRDLAEQFALELPTLDLPAVTAEETQAARRVVVAVQQVLDGGEMRDVPERELTALVEAARERLEAADPEAEDPADPELPFQAGAEGDPLAGYTVGVGGPAGASA